MTASETTGQVKRVACDGDAAQKRCKSSEDFAARLARLGSQSCARVAAAARLSVLSADEQALEERVLRPAVSSSAIDPAKSFLDCKQDYDQSPLLPLLRRMPKGAILHTHGVASGDFRVLVESLRSDGHFYVWQGEGCELVAGSIAAFPLDAEVAKGWVQARSVSQEDLHKSVTLPAGLPSVEVCWQEFGKLWERLRGVGCVAPWYFGRHGFFWSTMKGFYDANIMFLEIKEPLFMPWIDYDGTEFSDEAALGMFKDTVDAFRSEHPGFIGARVVMTALKIQNEEDVRQAFRRGASGKKKFPDYVAGFDMAGPEDVFRPIRDFAAVLLEERAAVAEQGVDFPLLLHAGETNLPEASQIFDAVAVGCERIGHGFAAARHPALVDEILAAGISLECCPISNQVLGYFPNLAAHQALGLFRAGVPMTISPDDAGMWHYSDVSYDFAAATKAWNLSLLELKALCRNSLLCSTLRGAQKEDALAAWEKQWDAWVQTELRQVATP